MTTAEIAELFQQYTDETDATFLSPQTVASFLNLGYQQFRSIVHDEDNEFYQITAVIHPNQQGQYDLASMVNPVRLLGPQAGLTHPRMYRLMKIAICSDQNFNQLIVEPATPSIWNILIDDTLTDLSITIDTTLFDSATYMSYNDFIQAIIDYLTSVGGYLGPTTLGVINIVSSPGLNTMTLQINSTTPPDTATLQVVQVGQNAVVEDTYYPTLFMYPARSLPDVINSLNKYMLINTKVMFSTNITNPVMLFYVPYPDKKITGSGSYYYQAGQFTVSNISGAGDFLDDLPAFQDLIALLAYRQYAIKDFASNPVLEQQLDDRKAELKGYLSEGRNFSGRANVIGSDEADYLGYT